MRKRSVASRAVAPSQVHAPGGAPTWRPRAEPEHFTLIGARPTGARMAPPAESSRKSQMLNLVLPLILKPGDDRGEGFLGKLAGWSQRQIRYRRALSELRRLDDRDLDDIDIAREDFHDLAWRHAVGLPPLTR